MTANVKEKIKVEDLPENHEKCSGPGFKRYIVAWLSCLGLLIVLAMRSEMGIAIIKMTKKTKEQVLVANKTNGSMVVQTSVVQEVAWNHLDVGLIEASFFVGYAIFSIPGGYMASVLPANLLLSGAIFSTCFLNLIVPVTAHLEPPSAAFGTTLLVRMLQGMSEGCLYPAILGMWRYWAPSSERSKLVTISFFGMALGPIVGLPLTGTITTNYGWPLNFYIFGAAGILWSSLWFFIVYEHPTKDPYITREEVDYIERESPPIKGQVDIPFKSIFTSVPVWAIVVANVGRNWSFQFSTIGLPSYFAKVFDLSSEEVGIYMCIPFLFMAILTPIGGTLADCCRRKCLSTANTRKVFNSVGFGMASLSLVFLSMSRNLELSTSLLTVCFGFTGLGMSGFGVNHLDIAPRYAGFLMGLSNGFGTISGVLSPIIASPLTRHGTAEEWQSVFIIAAFVHAVTVVVFAVWAAGEEQEWAKEPASDSLLQEFSQLQENDYGSMEKEPVGKHS